MPPPEALYNVDQLIDNTNDIYIVECVKAKHKKKDNSRNYSHYTLEVIKVLKGDSVEQIKYGGRTREYISSTYSNHSDTTFWNQNEGRSIMYNGECGPSHVFQEGHRYLLFQGSTLNRKSAERIETDSDLWIKYVEKRLLTK
jgi:hypothetical protein